MYLHESQRFQHKIKPKFMYGRGYVTAMVRVRVVLDFLSTEGYIAVWPSMLILSDVDKPVNWYYVSLDVL
jgi:hypothetical protein